MAAAPASSTSRIVCCCGRIRRPFGAGNLIFPLHLGQIAGHDWSFAAVGFLVTGVLLPLFSVLAIGKVLHLTREEIPHSVAVVVDSMKRDEETDKVHIRATIMVERDSQKGIVIGKGGAMLKKIGTLARKDIELMLGDKVFLETWVKVKKNWRDKKLDLADFGYNEKEY